MDVRALVAVWMPGPRGSVTAFCREHQVSRSWFHELRARFKVEGMAALQPRPRTPEPSRSVVPVEVEEIAVRLRKELADQGWDHGPVTVRAKMVELGVAAPSRATLARIFTRRGLVVPQPQKRPRSAWRRFVYPLNHGCWQLDGTDWALVDDTDCVVLQLLDDHSRTVMSRAAPGETAEAAEQAFDAAVARYQVPQRLLTDNATAFNPTRRGMIGRLVAHVQALGVKAITGRPRHPQTQGKDERVHQTLLRFLRARARAETLAELQAQLDEFDDYYNQRRPHQALGMRTPAQVLAEDPTAPPPEPPAAIAPPDQRLRSRSRLVTGEGTVTVRYCRILLGVEHAHTTVHLILDRDTVLIFDPAGLLIRTVQLIPGVGYYGNGLPRGRRKARAGAARHPGAGPWPAP